MSVTAVNRGFIAGDGTGESFFSAFGKLNVNDAGLEAAVIAAQSAADSKPSIAQVSQAAGEYTEAGVLVWPANTPKVMNYTGPLVTSVTTTYNGVIYTMTLTGDPVTVATVVAGGTTWTKTLLYSAGLLTSIGHWV